MSFEELYRASKIELNVVAADLSLNRQITFSHWRHHTVGWQRPSLLRLIYAGEPKAVRSAPNAREKAEAEDRRAVARLG
jgi:hypothetical protein